MHFERELPNYAEPVKANELKIGETYFAVQYLDEDLIFPVVEMLILTDTKPDEDGRTVFRFQDLGAGIRRETSDADSAIFYSQPEQYLNHIFDCEHAVDELMRCALRRRKQKLK